MEFKNNLIKLENIDRYFLDDSFNYKRVIIDCASCNIKNSCYKDNISCFECLVNTIKNYDDVVEIYINGLIKVPNCDFKLLSKFAFLKHRFIKIFSQKSARICLKNSKISELNHNFNRFKDTIKVFEIFNYLIGLNKIKTEKNFENSKIRKFFYVSICFHSLFKLYKEFRGYILDENLNNEFFSKETFLKLIERNFMGIKETKVNWENNNEEHELIKDTYVVEPNGCFEIKILENGEFEKKYLVNLLIDEKGDVLINELKNLLLTEISDIISEGFPTIGTIIKRLQEYGKMKLIQILKTKDYDEIEKISLISALKVTNLLKIYPLLVDKFIEEVYLDSINSFIYLDHQLYGRCNTEIKLKLDEIETIKTLIRMTSKKRLDFSNPSIKTTLIDEIFSCRISLDVAPLNANQFSLDIRKMNKQIFSIDDLIKFETLSTEIAAFLFFCSVNRINITVLGETNTGKTTLINSLDLIIPKFLRKIYIEEAPESLDLLNYSHHQVKYVVEKEDKKSEIGSKSDQIYRLLHRNPDLVYLGEILTANEASAMFHCLSAGLRGFQTIHARSIESLITRWMIHFNISPVCFNDLGIMIEMKKTGKKRYIASISEIEYKNNTTKINYIYKYNHLSNNWDCLKNIEEIKAIKNLINSKNFYHNTKIILNYLTSVFQFLVDNSINNRYILVQFFDKISKMILNLPSDKFLSNQTLNFMIPQKIFGEI